MLANYKPIEKFNITFLTCLYFVNNKAAATRIQIKNANKSVIACTKGGPVATDLPPDGAAQCILGIKADYPTMNLLMDALFLVQ